MSEPRQKEDKMEIMYVCAGHIWGLLSSSSLTPGATVKGPGVNVFLCSPAHNTPDWTRRRQLDQSAFSFQEFRTLGRRESSLSSVGPVGP